VGDDDFDLDAIQSAVARQLAAARERRIRWGIQGPPIAQLIGGHRVVAAYNELLTIRADATYHDFLGEYVLRILGEDWWRLEAQKSADDRHVLVNWHISTQKWMLDNSRGEGVVREAPMPPATGHLMRVAFNMHQIRHLGLLLGSLIKRIKNPQQFQGARYELAISAAFARANFRIELEPEGKGPQKRCEFVATHIPSKRQYSVEAKSRHRPGVLGRPPGGRSSKVEPHVATLIRKALAKAADHDRIICVDVNHPQKESELPPSWGTTIRRQVNDLESEEYGPAILIFTNAPFHYLPPGEPARGELAVVMGLKEPRFQPQDSQSVLRQFPGILDAANAFSTPVPSTWD